MKYRRTKSKMTKVDLDAVLKLQKEHTTLEERLNRLAEYAAARSEGHITYFLMGDDIIDVVAQYIDNMAREINKLKEKISDEQTDNIQRQENR